jgi:hypothetical protein
MCYVTLWRKHAGTPTPLTWSLCLSVFPYCKPSHLLKWSAPNLHGVKRPMFPPCPLETKVSLSGPKSFLPYLTVHSSPCVHTHTRAHGSVIALWVDPMNVHALEATFLQLYPLYHIGPPSDLSMFLLFSWFTSIHKSSKTCLWFRSN